MKVTFLDGPSLAEKIPELMASSDKMDVAMAYVKINALRPLLRNANRLVERGAAVRIVFGLSSRQGITDKESAESLLVFSRCRNVSVRKFNHPGFHPKLFIFRGYHPSIVVGSANITEAAQSQNAEANLLVEDADPTLLQDTLTFFEHYFNSAPELKPRDVDHYRPPDRQGVGVVPGGTREDFLPSPLKRKHELENMQPNKIWKIAPGANARDWNEWVNAIDDNGEGFVAMGWDVGDLNHFRSYDDLRDEVVRLKPIWDKEWNSNVSVKYVTDQLWQLKTAISKGDAIIVYSESRVLGVAEVTSESQYQYKGSQLISYENQMNVKYRWYKKWPRRADDMIVETLGKQGTLRLVEEKWLWGFLVKNLP